MLDIGFSEILVIFVLALIVLGPEKLPRVAAQVGRWIGRARSMARQFREQLEEEVNVEAAKKKPPRTDTPPPPPDSGTGSDGTSGGGAASAAAGAAVATGATGGGADPASGTDTPGATTTPEPTSEPHSSVNGASHLDLTHEPWPYSTPTPPPEVADVFQDVLRTPVPGSAGSTPGSSAEIPAATQEGPAAPVAPAREASHASPEVHWPHDHEIPETTPEKASADAQLTTHERGP